MIKLTSIQGEEFYLNPDLIERVDKNHDTMITLTSGKHVRVLEEQEEIQFKFIQYKKIIHGTMEAIK